MALAEFGVEDLDLAVEGAVTGTYRNSGQVCCGIERIYVEKSLYKSFLEKAVERAKALKVGNGLDPDVDMGPMNREEQITIVERHLKDAQSKGAKILTGGKRIEGSWGGECQPDKDIPMYVKYF